MKKLALALCLLAVSFTAQAQFEKGTTIINPSLSGLDFSYSKNDKAKFGVGAQVGTFFAEGIALMVNAGADWSKPVDEYTLGTGVRFYFNKTGIYLGGGLDWNRFRWSGGKHQTDYYKKIFSQEYIDRTISGGIKSQLTLLLVTIATALAIFFIIAMLFSIQLHGHEEWGERLWAVYNNFVDPGNQIEETAWPNRILVGLISISGSVLLGGVHLYYL